MQQFSLVQQGPSRVAGCCAWFSAIEPCAAPSPPLPPSAAWPKPMHLARRISSIMPKRPSVLFSGTMTAERGPPPGGSDETVVWAARMTTPPILRAAPDRRLKGAHVSRRGSRPGQARLAGLAASTRDSVRQLSGGCRGRRTLRPARQARTTPSARPRRAAYEPLLEAGRSGDDHSPERRVIAAAELALPASRDACQVRCRVSGDWGRAGRRMIGAVRGVA